MLLSFKLSYSQNRSGNAIFKPDTTVNKELVLLNSSSIIEKIGDQSGKLTKDADPGRVMFYDANLMQYLILYHLAGANANRFNEFEIGKLTPGHKYAGHIKIKLQTESGIELGISKQRLMLIKGKPSNVSVQKNQLMLIYTIRDVSNALLLKQNMPEYRAIYYFTNNKLVKFIYGFEAL